MISGKILWISSKLCLYISILHASNAMKLLHILHKIPIYSYCRSRRFHLTSNISSTWHYDWKLCNEKAPKSCISIYMIFSILLSSKLYSQDPHDIFNNLQLNTSQYFSYQKLNCKYFHLNEAYFIKNIIPLGIQFNNFCDIFMTQPSLRTLPILSSIFHIQARTNVIFHNCHTFPFLRHYWTILLLDKLWTLKKKFPIVNDK